MPIEVEYESGLPRDKKTGNVVNPATGEMIKTLNPLEITDMALEMFFNVDERDSLTASERKTLGQKVRRTVGDKPITRKRAEQMLAEGGELYDYFLKKSGAKRAELSSTVSAPKEELLNALVNQATIEAMLNAIISSLYEGREFDTKRFKQHTRDMAREMKLKPSQYEALCNSQAEIWGQYIDAPNHGLSEKRS